VRFYFYNADLKSCFKFETYSRQKCNIPQLVMVQEHQLKKTTGTARQLLSHKNYLKQITKQIGRTVWISSAQLYHKWSNYANHIMY